MLASRIIAEHVDFHPSGDGWKSRPELPTRQEILRNDHRDAIPHNDVRKPWSTKAKYLEAQYEILRCEAVEGLRRSVMTYKESATANFVDNKDTCIYTKVFLRGYTFSRMGPIFRIAFSTERSKFRINWQLSKRLTPGSLVVISPEWDNFQNICMVATVVQRRQIGGKMEPDVDLMWANPVEAFFDPMEEYVLLESRSGYYEASRHALVGLQHAARSASPLDKYLLGHHKSDQTAPSVLQEPIMNLRSLIHVPFSEASREAELFRHYNVLDGFITIQGVTNLDESQLGAVQRMLTKELAITQGPPGTGKTFTSVEALKILVANRRERLGDPSSSCTIPPPIVVTAQTNHALDQLLLHSMRNGAKAMRLGGRTENPDISPCTPYKLQQNRPKDTWEVKPDSRELQENSSTFNRLRKHHEMNVEEIQAEMAKWNTIMNPRYLLQAGVITRAQYESLGTDAVEPDFFGLWLPEEDRITVDMLDNHIASQRSQSFEDHSDYDHDEFEENTGFGVVVDEEDADDHAIKGNYVHLLQSTGKLPDGQSSEVIRRRVEEELTKEDFFEMAHTLRGAIFRELQRRMVARSTTVLRRLLTKNMEFCKGFKKNRWARDRLLAIGLNIDIIGCTTTGLTKYRGLLASLGPRILLVEEAAETREANIVSALYPSVEQLILVGDHQQLAPHCDIQWLADPPFNINVSLFERMVRLKMPFVMLDRQRRMAPEISSIVQLFYPKLKDHAVVLDPEQRPLIPGMGDCRCWFLDHNWPESKDANSSKFNDQEARVIVYFFTYLVRNGTPSDKITVLTYYNGQRKKLLAELRGPNGPGVHHAFNVFTIDAYQGEENDIIMLSLVRSPVNSSDFQIGFLKNPQRAIVSISRARRGFFVYGNYKNLTNAGDAESQRLWRTILSGFERQHCIDRRQGMPLVCQRHGNIIWVHGEYSWGANTGGCLKPCGEMRPCGHICKIMCHASDHNNLPCDQGCTKKLHCGHLCQAKCCQKCFCHCDDFHRRHERTFEEMLEDCGATGGPLRAFEQAHVRPLVAQPIGQADGSVSRAGIRQHPLIPRDTSAVTQHRQSFAVDVQTVDRNSARQLPTRGGPGPVITEVYRPVTLVHGQRTRQGQRQTPSSITSSSAQPSALGHRGHRNGRHGGKRGTKDQGVSDFKPNDRPRSANATVVTTTTAWRPSNSHPIPDYEVLGWQQDVNRDAIAPLLEPNRLSVPVVALAEAVHVSNSEYEEKQPAPSMKGALIDVGGAAASESEQDQDQDQDQDTDLMVFDEDDVGDVPKLIDF